MTEERSELKLFTVEQANQALPLVRAIVKDLVDLSREVFERRQRLTSLQGNRPRTASDVYSEELRQVEQEVERDTERLQEFAEELRALGVEPKSGLEGLVDFPSMMDGRVVYLCWRLGEPEVLHWHELDAGFAGRQPLVVESSAGGNGATGEGGV
jgi:hypothetical protein